jgi:hypothetical protein
MKLMPESTAGVTLRAVLPSFGAGVGRVVSGMETIRKGAGYGTG